MTDQVNPIQIDSLDQMELLLSVPQAGCGVGITITGATEYQQWYRTLCEEHHAVLEPSRSRLFLTPNMLLILWRFVALLFSCALSQAELEQLVMEVQQESSC